MAPRHRRLLAPVLLASLACLASCGGGGEDEARTRPAERAEGERPSRGAPVDRLSLREQVGQTIVFSYDGAAVPPYVRRILREGRGSGVILFGSNVVDARQVRRATRTLQRAARGSALICTDQEGGEWRILRFAASAPAPSTLETPAAVRSAAAATARDLRAVGVNVNLAPVVDVASPGSVVSARAFPGGPARVARLARAAVVTYERGGVGATAKHFPGFGAARENTDLAAVTIARDRATLIREDLEPFRAVIAADVPLVMASHALYPALDGRRIASQSPLVLRGLLRRRLGFRGAIVTDSIEARAVISRSSVATAALRSIRAGADLVLSTGSGSYRDVYDALLAAARRSPAVRARVRAAAARVIALKRRLGLRSSP